MVSGVAVPLCIVSYLVGAIPFGYVFGRLAGVDVRQHGSKNIGATNVSRTLGKKWGVLTLLCDVAKGFLPMMVATYLLGGLPGHEIPVCCSGVAAVLGHMFPVYLRFRGGKGVATALGVFCFLSPVAMLVTLAAFLVTVLVSGFVSAGSLCASVVFVLCFVALGASLPGIVASLIVAGLIWIKHSANIKRLVKGEEISWRKKKVAP